MSTRNLVIVITKNYQMIPSALAMKWFFASFNWLTLLTPRWSRNWLTREENVAAYRGLKNNKSDTKQLLESRKKAPLNLQLTDCGQLWQLGDKHNNLTTLSGSARCFKYGLRLLEDRLSIVVKVLAPLEALQVGNLKHTSRASSGPSAGGSNRFRAGNCRRR